MASIRRQYRTRLLVRRAAGLQLVAQERLEAREDLRSPLDILIEREEDAGSL